MCRMCIPRALVAWNMFMLLLSAFPLLAPVILHCFRINPGQALAFFADAAKEVRLAASVARQ